MKVVYIVIGATGEHSDYTMWHVRGYKIKEGAFRLARRLNEWCQKKGCDMQCKNPKRPSDIPREDVQFQCDPLTGTSYSVISIPMA